VPEGSAQFAQVDFSQHGVLVAACYKSHIRDLKKTLEIKDK